MEVLFCVGNGKGCRRKLRQPRRPLLFAEGHAVGALIHGGVALVGAHPDLVQGAVVGLAAVVGAGDHSAFDGLVGMAIHDIRLLLYWVRA